MNARTICLAIGLVMAGTAWGQDSESLKTPPQKFRWSLQMAFGYGGMDHRELQGYNGTDVHLAHLGLSARRGKFIRSIKSVYVNNEGSSGTRIQEIAFLLGRINNGRWGYVSASSGLSFMSVQRDLNRGTWPPIIKKSQTLGVPLELRALTTPLSFFGIGLGVMANLNSKRSYWGIVVGLEFGALR